MTSSVVLDKKEKGVFGKINSKILNEFGLGFPVFICELEIE